MEFVQFVQFVVFLPFGLRRNPVWRDSSNVQVPVVAVEIPGVVHVVPLSEPTVRAGRVDIRSSAVNDSRHPFYYIHN